jgi:Protein of unknown function (DUF4233)
MRMLASSVLVMESFVMGFALLLAMKDHSSAVLIVGVAIAILCLLAPGLLKKKSGWILGWVLQVALLAYGFVVTSMFLVGAIFLGLWIAAILVGKKGEAARAALLAAGPPNA